MKKLLAVLSSIIVLCTCVQAQSNNDTNINPLNVARGFALKTPTSFQCNLYGDALVSNAWKQVSVQFRVRKSDFAITNLSINNNNIPLPKPIYSLPLGNGGVLRNVSVGVSGWTESNEYGGNGRSYYPEITKDDQIEVVLNPSGIRQEIPVDVGVYGGNIQLDIEGFNYGYSYGVENGKFYVDLPPIGGKYHYVLRLSTGEPIGEGIIEPFHNAVTDNATFFGVKYAGNVLGVEFNSPSGNDSWKGVYNIGFDCIVPRVDGSITTGKVLFVDVGSGDLELSVNQDVYIYVQKVTENGDMPFLPLENHSVASQGYVETRMNTTSGKIGKVIIIIIPKSEKGVVGTFYLNLHRFYGPLSIPTGGGSGGSTGVGPKGLPPQPFSVPE